MEGRDLRRGLRAMRARRPALALFALGIGCFALVFSTQITAPRFASQHDPGPRFLPLFAGWATLILGSVAGLRRVELETEAKEITVSVSKLVGMLVGLALYVVLAPWLGFYLATTFFVIFFSRALGASWWVCVLGALGVSGVCYLVFQRLFHVALPQSALGLPF